ncbi:unnamed protein product [Discula destructiva]
MSRSANHQSHKAHKLAIAQGVMQSFINQTPTEDNILFTMPHTDDGIACQTMQTNLGLMDQQLHDGLSSGCPPVGNVQGTALNQTFIKRHKTTRRKQKRQNEILIGTGGHLKYDHMVSMPLENITDSLMIMDQQAVPHAYHTSSALVDGEANCQQMEVMETEVPSTES